jgi:hypothetical protein
LRQRDGALRLAAGATFDYFVDPLLGTGAPRGLTFTNVTLTVPPDWTVGLQGAFATSLSPRSADPTAVYPDETTLMISLTARHRVSQNLIVEFGCQYVERAARVAAPNFALHQLQLWFYVMLTATSRPVPEWLPP